MDWVRLPAPAPMRSKLIRMSSRFLIGRQLVRFQPDAPNSRNCGRMVRRSTFNRGGESSILSSSTNDYERRVCQMQIIDNIPVWGSPVDEGALKQIKTCYYIFGQAAMTADHHKGYGVPIGGVIAHENLVSPSGVGFDIGCGNKAVLTDADAADVRANIAKIMD